jgi:hypothetical protein
MGTMQANVRKYQSFSSLASALVEEPGRASTVTRAPNWVRDVVAYAPAGLVVPAAVAVALLVTGRGPRRLAPMLRPGLAVGLGCGALLALARWQFGRLFSETPRFEVERRIGNLEIRRYAPRVQAETNVPTVDWEVALSEGFARLARYISGKNTRRRITTASTGVNAANEPAKEKIAMAVPVTSSRNLAGQKIAFMMPQGRGHGSLPLPDDPRVVIHVVPAQRVAVLRFRGPHDAETAKKKQEELVGMVSDAGLTPLGEPLWAGYDAPSTLPLLRRVEVWLPIA